MKTPYQVRRPSRAPVIGNDSQRDPSGFGRGFRPRVQPDEVDQNTLLRDVGRGVVSIDQIIERLSAHNLPPQLVQAAHVATITAVGVPALLIPRNLRRQSFVVANPTANTGLVMTYGQPVQMGAALFLGIPIGAQEYFVEVNGSVSINDIWVTDNAAADTYPYFIVAYEGSLSVAGNPS
jgi:hypothetical protein